MIATKRILVVLILFGGLGVFIDEHEAASSYFAAALTIIALKNKD